MDKIELINVSKEIKKKKILEDINVKFEKGKIYGLVGKNGSGKTMLFRAISGLIKLSGGMVVADGKVLHKDISVLPSLGIVIENTGLYPEFTGFENLKLLSKINKKIDDKEIWEAIKRVGLDPADKRSFRKYSLGMKQKIVLAQAFMEDPEVLLLDEPTNALDEETVNLIREILLEEKEKGKIIIIASHSREDIEYLCDEVYKISNGRINVKRGGESNEEMV